MTGRLPPPHESGSRHIALRAGSRLSPTSTRRGFVPTWVYISLTAILAQSYCAFGSALAECVDYGEFTHSVGSVPFYNEASDVAVDGSYACVASHRSVQVIDITDPRVPRVVARLGTQGVVSGVALSGTYAYVANSEGSAFQVIDLAYPWGGPKLITGVTTSGEPRDVVVSGTHAYVADFRSGLQVIDIADPRNPSIVGSADTPGEASGLSLAPSGSLLYVADGSSGLQVVDISDPKSPRIVGSVDTPGEAKRLCLGLGGLVAFVADGTSGLQVVDVSDPRSPQITASLVESPGFDVATLDDRVYLASHGVQVIDIRDPQHPKVLAKVGTWDEAWGVAVAGNLLYVAQGFSGFQVFDITNSQPAPFIGNLDMIQGGDYYFSGIAISGATACAVGHRDDGGFYTIDISNPASPRVLSGITIQRPLAVTATGAYAYVVQFGPYLEVIDITDPIFPRRLGRTVVGTYDENADLADCVVSDGYAYVANGDDLRIVDVSDPLHPLTAAHVATPGLARGVAIAGTSLFVADGYSGLQVYDITNPRSPKLVCIVDTPRPAYDVDISGSLAYVAESCDCLLYDDGNPGLQVIDITDPLKPQIVGGAGRGTGYTRVTVSGTNAYVKGGNGARFLFDVIDVTNPQAPRVVGNVHSYVSGFALAENFMCTTESWGTGGEYPNWGFRTRPLQCDSTSLGITLQAFGSRWTCQSVEISLQLVGIVGEVSFNIYRRELPNGSYAAVSSAEIRQEESFLFEDTSAEPGKTYSYRVVILEDGNPVTSFDTEVATPRAAFVLHPNRPNPFNPTTRIDFSLDRDSGVVLSIFDVAGRHVQTLVREQLPPGAHSVAWDGRDDRGNQVGSGVYTVLLRADGRELRRKAILLK